MYPRRAHCPIVVPETPTSSPTSPARSVPWARPGAMAPTVPARRRTGISSAVVSARPWTAVVSRAVLAAAVTAVAHAPAAAAAPRTVPRSFVGINLDGPMIEPGSALLGPELQRVRRTGFGYVRAPMPWWYMEPRRPRSTDRRDMEGDVNFTESDELVLAAARAGLRVLPVVGRGTPDWASGNPFSVTVPPRDPADFARFVGALVRRYGPRGWFWGQHPGLRPRPIRRWQIWNEPDLRPFWDVAPWAPPYVRLLRAARRELRHDDPGATIIAAALTNRSWEDLAAVYDAG